MREALETAGAQYHRANPARARDFAKALGRRAKSDRVDARGCWRRWAIVFGPRPTFRSPRRGALQALSTRRRQLVEMRKQERTRLDAARPGEMRRDLERHITWLSARIALIEKRIAAAVEADGALRDLIRRLRTAPGVDPVVAALAAEMPELGALDRRRIASLAGLAPIARDSGQRRPTREIGGGRPVLRSLLHLAGLQASRRDPVFAAFRARLEAAGKRPKQAIIAVARKRLTTLNAMVRDGRDYAGAEAG